MKHLTFRQWLMHIRVWIQWLKDFPIPKKNGDNIHLYTWGMNSGHKLSMLCGRLEYDTEDIKYGCPKCVSDIKFTSSKTWECTSCSAKGNLQDLVGDDKDDLKTVQTEISKLSGIKKSNCAKKNSYW